MAYQDKFMLDVKKPTSVKYKIAKRAGMKSEMSMTQAMELAQRIEKFMPYLKDSCLCLGLMLSVNFNVGADSTEKCKGGMADLIGACYVHKCKCCPEFIMSQHNVYEWSRVCFNQLASGKCTDKYMQNTVGWALFPQHYATAEKQR